MGSASTCFVRLVALLLLLAAGSIGVRNDASATMLKADLLTLADQEARSCGDDDSRDSMICGGAWLARYTDLALLVMRSDECSVLLDALFAGQTCSFLTGDCGRMKSAPAVPSGHSMSLAVAPSPVLYRRELGVGPDRSLAVDPLRTASERMVSVLEDAPPLPPPRTSIA